MCLSFDTSPRFFGIQVIKEVAFLADESEKISDS